MIECVRLTAQAASDMRQARRWYDAHREDWGEVFLRRLEDCKSAIQEMPRRFPVAHGEIRRARVRQFPYDVYYGHSRTEVTIYAIVHTARAEEAWRNRLPEV